MVTSHQIYGWANERSIISNFENLYINTERMVVHWNAIYYYATLVREIWNLLHSITSYILQHIRRLGRSKWYYKFYYINIWCYVVLFTVKIAFSPHVCVGNESEWYENECFLKSFQSMQPLNYIVDSFFLKKKTFPNHKDFCSVLEQFFFYWMALVWLFVRQIGAINF